MGLTKRLARPILGALRRDPRRRVLLAVAGGVWRFWRRRSGRRAEVVYRTTLRSGRRLDVSTSDPLPRRIGSRRLRREVEAALRADLRR